MPAGAKPADPGDPADGPVSGAFVVDGTPADVARQMQAGLTAAGYSTEALSGPFEDGSLVVDSVGPDPACRVQTRVRGLGGTTMITILFGAACPWG
jgi:alkanesulfonate monooxygenase SsuD/methylene tetrahydromethanopterin reductase-like flavin-dependent oxidoreductase (luciferase family)